MSRYKKLYEAMLQSGELKELYPRLTGEWEQDEKKFIKEQKLLEDLAGAIDLYDED